MDWFEAGTIPLRKMLRSQGVLNTKIKSNRHRRVPEGREAAGEARSGGADGVDLAVRGALVSVTDEHDGADGAEDRGGRGGRGGQGAFSRGRGRARARGVRGRGAAPSNRQCPGCGGSYSSAYLPRHRRAHCPTLPSMVKKTTMKTKVNMKKTKVKTILMKRLKNLGMGSM